jgi:hypothetical protein
LLLLLQLVPKQRLIQSKPYKNSKKQNNKERT